MLDVSSDVIHFIPKSKDNLNKVERRCRWYLWYRKLFSTISLGGVVDIYNFYYLHIVDWQCYAMRYIREGRF